MIYSKTPVYLSRHLYHPSTLNPEPSTLNPNNPKPSTLERDLQSKDMEFNLGWLVQAEVWPKRFRGLGFSGLGFGGFGFRV